MKDEELHPDDLLVRTLERLTELAQAQHEPRAPAMPPAVCAALVKAQVAAQAVGKSSKNAHYGYRYASAEALIEESRRALAETGLAVITEGWTVEEGQPSRMHVQYLLVEQSGETWRPQPCSTPILPEKGRPDDKAEATSLTYNIGYFLRGLLLLPRVEEGTDVDQRDDTKVTETRRPNKIPFGPGKGKSFEEATIKQLDAYRAACARKLNDPQWGQRNAEAVAAIDSELQRRAGGEAMPGEEQDRLVEELREASRPKSTEELFDDDNVPF